MNPDAMDLSGDMAFKAHGELVYNLCSRNPAEADRVMAEAARAAICNVLQVFARAFMAGATSNRFVLQASAAEGATVACNTMIAGTSACCSLVLLSLTSERAEPRNATASDPQQSLMSTGAVPVCVQLIYEALPKGTVHFGHAIKHLSQDEDGVLLQFAEQPDARADFVVAADGYELTILRTRILLFLCTYSWTTPLTGTV